MIDGERKLATVRRIAAIDPIEGADAIVCVTVDGWKLVSNKENGFKVDDLVIYLEIDSFLPCIPEFEWMRARCYKNTSNLGEGFRVRTIKLRGQVSQGLIVPLNDFFESDESGYFYWRDDINHEREDNSYKSYLQEGDDVTAHIGVKKWEVPVPAALAGTVRGSFPSFMPKTDQDRAQNCFARIQKWIFYTKPEVTEITDQSVIDSLNAGTYSANTDLVQYFNSGDIWFLRKSVFADPEVVEERSRFEASLKLDGSSMTVYYNEGQLGVCSRNQDLKRTEGNSFWTVAIESGLIAYLAETGRNWAFQGELMGPGVQGNRENLLLHEMYVFDIYDIDASRYLSPEERKNAFIHMTNHEYINTARIKHVPLVIHSHGTVSFTEQDTIDTLLFQADRQSIAHPIAEGIVFKSLVEGGPTFKIINNKFLLKEKD